MLTFRDSLLISGFLLVNTIIVRGITTCGVSVPNWVDSTTGFMGTNKFGQIFLSKSYLIERVRIAIQLEFLINRQYFIAATSSHRKLGRCIRGERYGTTDNTNCFNQAKYMGFVCQIH